MHVGPQGAVLGEASVDSLDGCRVEVFPLYEGRHHDAGVGEVSAGFFDHSP